jgi:hypothetical protein
VAQGDLLTIQLVTTGVIAGTPNLTIATQFGTTGSNGTVNTATQFQVGEYLANGTAISGVSIPNCPDSGGNHVNFASGTGVFTCGTTGNGGTNHEISRHGAVRESLNRAERSPGSRPYCSGVFRGHTKVWN